MATAIRCQDKTRISLRGRLFILGVVAIALLGTLPAAAQQTGPVEPGAGRQKADSALQAAEKDLQIQKLRAEMAKLVEETKELHTTNEALGTATRWATAWGGVIGGLLGTLVTILIFVAGRGFNKTQKEKMEQENSHARETHLLEIFRDLGNETSPRIRLGAVAILVQKIAKISAPDFVAKEADKRDLPTMVSVLLAASKQESTVEVQKQIADGLANALGALVKGKEPSADEPSPFRSYDFQRAKLSNAWWKKIDAREVDFYKAELVQAGLRDAFLSGAVLQEAKLAGSSLIGAQLNDADLQGADLTNAKLTGANLNKAKLGNAILKRADLTEADLTGANLDGADLRGAKLKGARYTVEQLKSCNTAGVDFG